MINLIKIEPQNNYTLKLYFSDNSSGILDFTYMVKTQSSLTKPLESLDYFQACFIDFGALCWKNGLELSAESLYRKCKENGTFHINQASA
ncbi:DUF2442 domain-containing protein [Sulfurospirillum halorespirans]|uniref:DUF2442 domain-containing protein n=1 Tax=Sulfurospirillum halorespirans DSM 13726 TaxID=1193502 RepID=A0A1D7TP54_9BACT|nr:DUF2442 domain-containing protein [Sulfurospirillum halorespirans]AOO66767.1 hypothetical protein SHALO_3020 [Sulfurospirillum halorespirans DSM 13726]